MENLYDRIGDTDMMRTNPLAGALLVGVLAGTAEAAPQEGAPAITVAPNHPLIAYRGAVEHTATATEATFRRAPCDSPFAVDSPCTAITFRTASSTVTVWLRYAAKTTFQPAHHVFNHAGVCLVDGREAARYTRPSEGSEPLPVRLTAPGPGEHTYEVWLPYADSVAFLGLALEQGAALAPLPDAPAVRYVAHGDSITHGFRATDTTASYPYLLAKAKGWACANVGFGSRQCVAGDGALIAAQRPDVVTILIGVNDCLGSVPIETYRARYAGLLDALRAGAPTAAVYAITPLSCPGKWKGTDNLEAYREAVRTLARERKDPRLFVVEGPDLIPSEARYFADGLHPNDEGFRLMAENLGARVREK